MNTPIAAIASDANSPTLSGCVEEIATRGIPWAGDPGADFDTGLYAVLDHVEAQASAVVYYRPEEHRFLMYVYVPSNDAEVVAEVTDAITSYMQQADVVNSSGLPANELPGAVLHELDATEAHKRLKTICEQTNSPADDLVPFAFH
ncbi:MAG: hypothetical protein NTZ79_09130 [Proteobacteria bacterium]|nr:hypothetical protein [Pseudomonadota bacterium]